jgi:hypothetical protein
MTVGEMWEDYLEWKRPQLQPTTFELLYKRSFTNPIKGKNYNRKNGTYLTVDNPLSNESLDGEIRERLSELVCCTATKRSLISALSEAFTRLQSLGKTKLTANPFVVVGGIVKSKTDKYKSTVSNTGEILRWWDTEDNETDPEENDRRALLKKNETSLSRHFTNLDKPATRQVAPLVEFLFLTGCRSGEAFAH